jgi:hypothetical protein
MREFAKGTTVFVIRLCPKIPFPYVIQDSRLPQLPRIATASDSKVALEWLAAVKREVLPKRIHHHTLRIRPANPYLKHDVRLPLDPFHYMRD